MPNVEPVRSPCYCINFRHAAGVVSKFYDAVLSDVDLTGNQFFLLNSIRELDGCNKSELAQYTRLDRTTIIRNLETLKKKGLIEEAPGTTRRNNIIRLSETGLRSHEQGKVLWHAAQKDTEQILGSENLAALRNLYPHLDRLEQHTLIKKRTR